MKPTKIAFEKRYFDDSGCEFGVRYDEADDDKISLECRGTIVRFPDSELAWFIERLQQIQEYIL